MAPFGRFILTPNPKHTVIERTAAELAATFYEAGRSSGMTSQFKTPRAYAKHYLEMYISKAVELLTEMLGNPTLPDLMKQEIYDALLERVNDPQLNAKFPEYLKTKPVSDPKANPDAVKKTILHDNPFRKNN